MEGEWNPEMASKVRGAKNCQFPFAKSFVDKLDKSKKKFLDLKTRPDTAWRKFALEVKSIFLQMMVTILQNLEQCVNKEQIRSYTLMETSN